jgi:CHAD domain-containing protein
MRIALARLRTAILFFSPMVADSESTRLKGELKWLNAHLGVVRDLDVAVERLNAASKPRPQAIPDDRSWKAKRADSQRHLARALRSVRYRRLIERLTGWVESGPWSVKRAKQATTQRATPIVAYSAHRLARWQDKLLKKSRKLPKMGTEKRHRLRLMNKKLCYSIEFFADLFPNREFSKQQAALKYLRKAQKSLGQLNDDAIGQSLATGLARDGVRASIPLLSRERERRLIRTAATAYRKLAALKSFRV